MRGIPLFLRLLFSVLFFLLAIDGDAAYREAVPGYRYQFPRDHFEHPDFRTEWWYYTGNVKDAAGKRYGFELVFFRQGEPDAGAGRSTWQVHDLYLAHAALTDAAGHRFHYEERLNRAGPGIAGASFQQQRIWNGNWSAVWNGEEQQLSATAADFRFQLDLKPAKPYIIEGENGVSQKAEGRGRASYYVSFPLLKVRGTINGSHVEGTSWMDHEWFTEQLGGDQVGWDWFSVQFSDGTELMLYELRRKDGSTDPYSSGTYIDAAGRGHHLKREDFQLQPLSRWNQYPVEWRVTIPSLKIDVISHPVLKEQELKGSTRYWEGAVDYSGTHTGVGYLEMTGYADAPISAVLKKQ